MANQLDEAFNWLVLILSTIAGALSQFPGLYPLSSPRVEVAIIRLLVFPVIILVFLWLSSLLAKNVGVQVVVKSFSWIFASIILMADLVLLILSILPKLIKSLPGGPGATPLDMLILASVLFSPLYFSLLFCLLVVRPRMREIYRESKLLHSLPRQALLYVAAVLSYILAIGAFEEVI